MIDTINLENKIHKHDITTLIRINFFWFLDPATSI